ncbi:MAG TPA: hypothetical protein PKK23_19920 [Nitrospirales bacterium]|nr:hypothetical protein [Nitrospirales bacterium]
MRTKRVDMRQGKAKALRHKERGIVSDGRNPIDDILNRNGEENK